jgi:hypothetical protein
MYSNGDAEGGMNVMAMPETAAGRSLVGFIDAVVAPIASKTFVNGMIP